MKIIPWPDLKANGSFSEIETALSIGVFDGLHIGHRDIISRITRDPRRWLPVVVTFNLNPQVVLRSPAFGKNILTGAQKLAVMESLGVAVAVVIDFSAEFSRMSAKSFFESLSASFRVKKVVEGPNFHFGNGREAGRDALRSFCETIGADLETPATVMYRETPVSSTRVRHTIRSGRIDEVLGMMAGDFTVIVPPETVTAAPDGTLVAAKNGLSQVVPDEGSFRCLVAGDAAARESVVEIDKEKIFIRSGMSTVKTISFTEKIEAE